MSLPSLYPHQTDGVHLVHDTFRRGFKDVCYTAPTGMGKRRLGVWWAAKAMEQSRRVMIATDRRMLVDQMSKELTAFDVPHGVVMGDRPERPWELVQVCSIQTLQTRGCIDTGEGLPPADLLLVDEAHKNPTIYKKLRQKLGDIYTIGLTATPVDERGVSLEGKYYSIVVEGVKNSTLVSGGYLLPVTVICPSEPDIAGVKINGEEFNQKQLHKAIHSVTTFSNVFDEWAPFANRQTIVFAPGVAYCRGLAYGEGDSFRARGITAEVVDSSVPPKEREAIYQRFLNKETRVILSVDILKEGSDLPVASCEIDLQPNAQLRTYWQKVGRIKRLCEGQSDAVYIDMAGNLWRHGFHPDEDPDWFAVKGEFSTAMLTLAKRKREASDKGDNEPKLIVCPRCFQARRGGAICPNCKHEYEKQVKHVRMGDGKLKEVSAEYVEKHKKSELEKRAAKWKSELFIGLKKGRSLAQCRTMYHRRHGEWPPNGIPCTPDYGSVNWKMRVDQVYTPQRIGAEFGRWESRAKSEASKPEQQTVNSSLSQQELPW